MAAITKKDLEFLTTEQIKEFSINQKTDLSPIKEYIENGDTINRINRVQRLLNIIIVERFIKGTL